MDLSIVVPVYNSSNILPEFVDEVKKEIKFVDKFELILVNDNSPDSSWDKIKELQKKYPFIKGLNLMKNYSQHNAIMAGIGESVGDIVVIMDDDLQHSPSDIVKIFSKIKNDNYDVCYTKFGEKKHTNWKILGSWFNDKIANILINKPKKLYLSPFKGMSRQVADLIVDYEGPYPYVDGLILSVTDNITYVEANHNERYSGEGNYTLIKSISLWTKMATGFSVLPLRFATYVGSLVSLISLLAIVYFILQKILIDRMPDGWSTIVVLVLFFGGLQLFTIGVIGEYVGRIYLNINSKKQYIVRDKVSSSGIDK